METFLNVMLSFNQVKSVLCSSVNGTFQEAISHMGIVSPYTATVIFELLDNVLYQV